MTQFAITVTGNQAVMTHQEGILTAGMTGAWVTVTFNEAWEGLQRLAVFRCGETVVDVPMEESIAPIPSKALLPDEKLHLGLYGTDGEETVIPTVWVELGLVEAAADPSGDESTDPTLPIWATLQAQIDALGQEEGPETFSASGELVECQPEPGTPLAVVSHFSHQSGYYLHLYHLNSRNILDFLGYVGGPGTVLEKNGLKAVINADGTATLSGTNTSTGYSNIIEHTLDSDTAQRFRFPPGTYTTPKNLTVYLKAAPYDGIPSTPIGNRNGTFTVDSWFSIDKFYATCRGGATLNETLPLVMVRGATLPAKDFLFSGNIHRLVVYQTTSSAGTLNWATGEVKDADGNPVATLAVPEILGLPGTNYLWTDTGTVDVSGEKLGIGAVLYSPQSLTKSQQAQARENIGAAALTDYEYRNMLTGKIWYACGDSFTASVSEQFTGGLYDGKNKVYPYFIGRRCGMEVNNLAVGGQTMAYVAGLNNCFSDGIYRNIGPDADYITLRLGINDDNQNVPIGTIDDADNTTFYGAWNVVMEYLIRNHPFAHIGIIVPNGAGSEYVEAVKAIAVKWGVPYLDFATGQQVPLLHRTQRSEVCSTARNLRLAAFRVSDTDTHPNADAHEYQSYCIEHWLMSL